MQWKPDRRELLGGGLSTGLTGPLWDRGQSSEYLLSLLLPAAWGFIGHGRLL